MTVLVVDDSEMVRFATGETLREAGFEVREASTGGEALASAADIPDVILLDVRLPDIDGFEVCRRLKADPTTAFIPVLHLSGVHRDLDDRVRGLETGADAYLTRPVEPAELVATVKALVRLRRSEANLRESEARRSEAEALAGVGRLLAQSLDPAKVAEQIAESVLKLLAVRIAVVYRLDPESGDLISLAVSGDPGRTQGRPIVLPRGTGVSGLAVRECRPVVTGNALADARVVLTPETRSRAERGPFRAMLAVPLAVQGRTIGALTLGDVADRTFDQDAIRLAEAFADQAALALENARVYADAHRRRRTAEALASVQTAITATLDLEAILEVVVDQTCRLLGTDRTAVAILESDGPDPVIRFVARRGMSPGFLAQMRPRHWDDGTTPRAIGERRPIWSADLLADPEFPLAPETRAAIVAEGYRAVLSAPLLRGERALGALVVYRDTPGPFSSEEADLLQALAAQAAIAINNARLFEDTERRRREAEVLGDLVRGINASLDLDTVLQRVTEGARELCGTDLAAIALQEPGSDTMVSRFWTGARADGHPVPSIERGAGAGAPARLTGRPVRTDAEGLTSLVVPIEIAGTTEGLLYVENGFSRAFTARDEAILTRLANHAAIAIHNARLLAGEQNARATAEAAGRRFHELVQSLDAIVWETDAGSPRFSFVSHRAEAILGYPVTEWLADADFWTAHLHPEDRAAAVGVRLRAIRDGGDHQSEYRMLTAEGRVVWLRDVVQSARHTEGRSERLHGVMVDITERKRAEAALRESEERFRSAFEHSAVGMALQSTDGRYLRVNDALCRMLGYPETELLGLGHPAVTHPDDVATDAAYDRRLVGGELASYQTEKRYYAKRGDIVWGLVTVSLVSDAGGRPGYFVVQVQDVTERKHAEVTRVELEGQLQQAQKLEAIGRLAGGIAHDFNNLLTVIIGRTQLLLQRARVEDEVRRHVELVQKTAERAASLTRQLLAFGRKQILRPKMLDVSTTVTGMEAMLRRLIGEHIELITVQGARSAVLADPVQVEQVVMNLAVNARDAMPDGGVLTIETGDVELDEAFVRHHAGARPGAHVLLAVSDTGRGMDAQVRARLFEPFFTTKELGQGTGLGLATVYGIVKQSEGYIYVESEPGRGTRFELYFPSAGNAPDLGEERSTLDALPRGVETVLLVEDEADVLAVTRDMLLACGYTVLEARNGAEALDLASRHPARISLLLTDVVMPGMSGRQLADRLTARFPGAKVLFMSGYTDDAIVHHGVLDRGIAFLYKPFTPEVLAQRVREVLDAG